MSACELITEHGGLGHTSAVYAHDDSVIDHFASRVRTGRILVARRPRSAGSTTRSPRPSRSAAAPGGSNTTDNVNYRNLLNVKTVSRRQAPPQWFRVPSDTYFNAGAIENLRDVKAEKVLLVTDTDGEARGWPTR